MNRISSYYLQSGCRFFALMVMVSLWAGTADAATRLLGIRVVHQEHLVLHIDLDQKPVDDQFFTLSAPDRLVIDLAETSIEGVLADNSFAEGVVKGVRAGVQDGLHLRLVVDLRTKVSATYKYISRQSGFRLVVDLGVKGNPSLATSKSQITERKADTEAIVSAQATKKARSDVAKPDRALRSLIVVIDAGHGGKDPGAIGRKKTQEKKVTLQIAKQLFKRLNKEKGIKALLVRNNDEYVSLRDRLKFARDHRADLFISIHADAGPRKTAKGSSVYVLSLDEASSETAKWLAEKENSADLFGDVELDGRAPDLQQTLLEMARSSTLESSVSLGRLVVTELEKIGHLHKNEVEFADFAVLKSPDIPSVLVETAFLSNPREEKKLRSRRYRDRLARALQTSIMNYFIQRAPEGTILANALGISRGS